MLVADGVGGLDLCGTALRYVLGAERVPYAIQVLAWGHGLGRWHADLTDVGNRDAKAQSVADTVRRYKDDRPGDPVFLVAKSGGAGVVVKALELLDHEGVERVVLLAPALSPGLRPHPALCARAPRDRGLLVAAGSGRSWGRDARFRDDRSRQYRKRRTGRISAASSDAPDDAGSHPYDKLRQVRWRPGMATTGYFGGHLGRTVLCS